MNRLSQGSQLPRWDTAASHRTARNDVALNAGIKRFSPSQILLGSQYLADDPEDRWSWTNSEAPPTPRIQPPTRFHAIKSWIRSWPVDEEQHEQLSAAKPRPGPAPGKLSNLKNQASAPVLRAFSEHTECLTKSLPASEALQLKRIGTLSSIFRPARPASFISSKSSSLGVGAKV